MRSKALRNDRLDMKHANIPIFIPHLGCPNQCVFCNQRFISGVESFCIDTVEGDIEKALSTLNESYEVEIAFFGGSFTGIDRTLMISLLKIANRYLTSGAINGIRCSTRPDYIDTEVLSILKEYGVTTIELGLQSMDDRVLKLSKRGHTAADAEKACRLILDYGFELVGQMMIGLPGSTPEGEIKTAEKIIQMGASGARIYPTVVFRETELAFMLEYGKYKSLSLEDAISRSAAVYGVFLNFGVEVIRIGLCASENLSSDKTYLDGPNHEALGEIVKSEHFYMLIKNALSEKYVGKSIIIRVAKGYASCAIGHGRRNKKRLSYEFKLRGFKVREDDDLRGYEFEIIEEGKAVCI